MNYIDKKESIALISDRTPLLRDLTILENIALILEYHESLPIKTANRVAFKLLKRCSVERLHDRRVYQIDKKDSLTIKYLRAYISNFKTILIDRPFSMLDSIEDVDFIFELAKLLDEKRLEIVDLVSNDYYKDRDVIQ